MIDTLTISRLYENDCTIGIMHYNEHRFFTLELPWNDNSQNVSCIPAGYYKCIKVFSGKYGQCVEVRDVIHRTLIRIHWGNYTSDTKGCILVGDSLKDINKDYIIDVTNSKATFKKLMGVLPDEFLLEIS